MMLDVEAFIYQNLISNQKLISLVGDASHITAVYPETFTVFPLVIFRLIAQPDAEYGDNVPIGNDCTFAVDVFVLEDDTYPISSAVYDIFYGLKWGCVYNEDVPDPDIRVRHRALRFSRLLFAGDIQ